MSLKSILGGAAAAFCLLLAYFSAKQFAMQHEPWALLCTLSIVLGASTCGLLRREAQFQVCTFGD